MLLTDECFGYNVETVETKILFGIYEHYAIFNLGKIREKGIRIM